MATFTAGGHEWRVRLTLGLVGRLRTDAAFELGKEVKAGDFTAALFFDPERLGRVLWCVCRDEAGARGITAPDAFFDLLGPDELEAAATAFVEAVVDFFHRGRADQAKAKLPGLMAAVNTKAGAAMAAEIDAAVTRVAAMTVPTPSESAGSSPASAGSTPPA